uniref:Uncharacterized protein n=1 Tax=Arundo donax TaxID=35708 RepID=A0A0A9DR65_ARUDO
MRRFLSLLFRPFGIFNYFLLFHMFNMFTYTGPPPYC